jgi:hypothetical protein
MYIKPFRAAARVIRNGAHRESLWLFMYTNINTARDFFLFAAPAANGFAFLCAATTATAATPHSDPPTLRFARTHTADF